MPQPRIVLDKNYLIIDGVSYNGNASVDRKDSLVGCVEGNIQLLDKTVNMCKRQLSNEDFIKMCKLVGQYN